jgi:hypothetical protein
MPGTQYNAEINVIPRLTLISYQAMFKLILTLAVTVYICITKISENLYSFKRMRYYINNDERSSFDRRLYMFLTLICWIDLIIASQIIMLTDIALRTAVTPYDMILGLCAVRILCDFDDYFAGGYINLIVKWSEDGLDLTSH